MSFALLEAAADPSRPWTFAFIGITFAAYLFIGWRSRVRETSGFYVAGQGVPAIANGAATAADWMSAASFLGMAGLISVKGSDGSMYLMGWTGGYVLLALLLRIARQRVREPHQHLPEAEHPSPPPVNRIEHLTQQRRVLCSEESVHGVDELRLSVMVVVA